MKKRNIMAVLAILAVLTVYPVAAENLQKTYTVRDEAYLRVDALSRRAGVLGPSSFSPMNARALIIALERIDVSSLSSKDKKEYEGLMQLLIKGDKIYDSETLDVEMDLDINLQANIADYGQFNYFEEEYKTDRREEIPIPYRYQDPFLRIYPKFFFGNSVFIEGDFTLENNSMRLYESSLGWLITGVDGKLDIFKENIMQYNPLKAGLSLGNNYISLIIGRYPHSIGSGVTGNMIVGDNFTYQEIGALSFLSNHFSYSMSLARFSQQEYLSGEPVDVKFSRLQFTGMQQVRSVHRMDATFFDKLRLALDFGTMYNSTSSFDLRYFIPFMLQHNYYNYTNDVTKVPYDEANNIMGITLEYVPARGLSLMAQFVLDQYQLPTEDPDSVPIAYGVMANIKHSALTRNGQINSYIEGVYTNPFIYLNRKENDDGTIDVNLDYFVGYNYNNEYNFSGYAYGPDAIVFSLGSEYADMDRTWNIGGRLLYKIQGDSRIRISSSGIDMSGVIFGHDPSSYMGINTPSSGWDNAEHLIKFTGYGSYNMTRYGLSFYGAAGMNTYFNYDNVKGETKFLPQATVGIKWSAL